MHFPEITIDLMLGVWYYNNRKVMVMLYKGIDVIATIFFNFIRVLTWLEIDSKYWEVIPKDTIKLIIIILVRYLTN